MNSFCNFVFYNQIHKDKTMKLKLLFFIAVLANCTFMSAQPRDKRIFLKNDKDIIEISFGWNSFEEKYSACTHFHDGHGNHYFDYLQKMGNYYVYDGTVFPQVWDCTGETLFVKDDFTYAKWVKKEDVRDFNKISSLDELLAFENRLKGGGTGFVGGSNGLNVGSGTTSSGGYSEDRGSSDLRRKHCHHCGGGGGCSSCGGRGHKYNAYSHSEDDCPSCNGSGRCPICRGTGRI